MIELNGLKAYTIAETADILNISAHTVRTYLKDDKLQGQRVGRTIIIPENSIKRLIVGVEVKEDAERL